MKMCFWGTSFNSMQRIFIVLLVLLSFFSCQKVKNEQFEFNIEGSVKNGEEVELTLLIPNDTLSKPINTKIKNGKFYFTGKSNNIQYAEIRFRQDLKDNNESIYSLIPVFIEKEKVNISFELAESKYYFKDISKIKFNKGYNSQLYYKEAINSIIGKHFTFINDYHLKKDSMHEHIYPTEKNVFFKKFDSICQKTKSVAYLKVLSFYLGNKFPPFDPDYITKEEKDKLNEILDTINIEYSKSNIYKELKFNINNLNAHNSKVNFSNFILKNEEGNSYELKKIISKNDYTVIDFWWTGCSPCRVFNKEGNKIYSLLKKNGIEIVGINVDTNINIWKKTSKIDNINWINLYAGPNHQIQIDYQVKSFPTKIIFNSNFEILNFEFKTPEELLKLKEN